MTRIAPVSPLGRPSTILRDGDAHPLAPYVRALIAIQERPTLRQWRHATTMGEAVESFTTSVERFTALVAALTVLQGVA